MEHFTNYEKSLFISARVGWNLVFKVKPLVFMRIYRGKRCKPPPPPPWNIRFWNISLFDSKTKKIFGKISKTFRPPIKASAYVSRRGYFLDLPIRGTSKIYTHRHCALLFEILIWTTNFLVVTCFQSWASTEFRNMYPTPVPHNHRIYRSRDGRASWI